MMLNLFTPLKKQFKHFFGQNFWKKKKEWDYNKKWLSKENCELDKQCLYQKPLINIHTWMAWTSIKRESKRLESNWCNASLEENTFIE